MQINSDISLSDLAKDLRAELSVLKSECLQPFIAEIVSALESEGFTTLDFLDSLDVYLDAKKDRQSLSKLAKLSDKHEKA